MGLLELVFVLFKQYVKLLFYFSNNALFSIQPPLGLIRQVTWGLAGDFCGEGMASGLTPYLEHSVTTYVTFSKLRKDAYSPTGSLSEEALVFPHNL